MEALQWLFVGSAAIAGAGLGAAACHWQMSRTTAALRARVERAELARNGAIERSSKAREHIAQLYQSIAEIRKSQSMSAVKTGAAGADTSAQERRARAEAALAAARPEAAAAETFGAFVDTEVLADNA